jgi:hypothetical protein
LRLVDEDPAIVFRDRVAAGFELLQARQKELAVIVVCLRIANLLVGVGDFDCVSARQFPKSANRAA